MNKGLALALKETRDIMRERSIVLALLVQLFVAAFSAFITVGLVGLYDPAAIQAYPPTRIAYVGPGGFDTYLDGESNLRVQRLDLGTATARFEEGSLFAIVEEAYLDEDGARTITILMPESEFRTTLLVNQFKVLLRDYERDLRFEREDRLQQDVVYAETHADANAYFGFAYAILLPLLVTTPIFLAGAITGDTFSDEINTGTMTVLRSTPMSASAVVLGKLAAPVLLVPVQVLLWVQLLAINGLPVANLPILLGLSLVAGLFVSCVGVMLAVLIQREGHMQAAYAAVVLVIGVLALLLPRDPFNLVARIGVGTLDTAGWITMGAYVLVTLAALVATFRVVERRARSGAL